MSRYKVTGPWGGRQHVGNFFLQSADITDQRNGHVYQDGAYRVVDARKVDAKGQMKPAKVGKGGTVPFYGECAWSDGERLLRDLHWADQRKPAPWD